MSSSSEQKPYFELNRDKNRCLLMIMSKMESVLFGNFLLCSHAYNLDSFGIWLTPKQITFLRNRYFQLFCAKDVASILAESTHTEDPLNIAKLKNADNKMSAAKITESGP